MRSYDQVQAIFEENGCKLLETEYVNNRTKMRYVAQCGHEHQIDLSNFLAGKGRVCRDCRYKSVSKKNTHEYDFVESYFEENGCKLLSPEYKDASHTKLMYIAQCGHVNYATFNKFRNGVGRICLRCSKSFRYTYEDVAKAFNEKGCVLLEDTYINCKTPMRYIATCGHESTISFDVFTNAKSATLKCPKCQQLKHFTYEEVEAYFEDNGCKLLSDSYFTAKSKLKYVASCGHKSEISFQKFLSGHGRKCNRCSRPSGKDHWNFNPDLTDNDRERREMQNGKIRIARNKAFERDGYTCMVCGDNRGGNLEAHHLDSWDDNVERRFDVSNLVTLCESCHKKFHSEYGYGHNTKSQFDEYVRSYVNTEGLKINQVCNE